MLVTIAPLSDKNEVSVAKDDCENKKQEIKDPHTVSHKIEGLITRQQIAVNITAEGDGVLKKKGKSDVPCYYFIVEYQDNKDKASKRKRK